MRFSTSVLRLFVCLALLGAGITCALAERVASAGNPKFSIEVPNGWKAEAKTNESNQQIVLQSSTRMMVVIGVEVTNGDPAKVEAGALEWMKTNKFPTATVVTQVKTATFGSHQGHEMTIKDKNSSGEFAAWLGSFYIGKIVFISIGISPVAEIAAAAGDYRAVVATVQAGGSTVASTGQPKVSTPGMKERLKNALKAFKKVLQKIPVFKPKEQ